MILICEDTKKLAIKDSRQAELIMDNIVLVEIKFLVPMCRN